MYQNVFLAVMFVVLNLCETVASADWKRPCAPRNRNYCLNGGVCFRVRTVLSKNCECRHGFTGPRCEFQNPILTRSAYHTRASPIEKKSDEDHMYMGSHTPIQRRSPIMVSESEGSEIVPLILRTLKKSADKEENVLDRATEGKYDVLEKLLARLRQKRYGSNENSQGPSLPVKPKGVIDGGDSKSNGSQTLLSNILSRIMRIKLQERNRTTENTIDLPLDANS